MNNLVNSEKHLSLVFYIFVASQGTHSVLGICGCCIVQVYKVEVQESLETSFWTAAKWLHGKLCCIAEQEYHCYSEYSSCR